MEVFHTDRISGRDFERILSILKDGGVIGFPTDTAYGLGTDPFNAAAIDRIFAIKGRAEAKPILLLVNSVAMAESVSEPAPPFHEVAARFWPGPLTVIVPASNALPVNLTANTGTIGLRWPVATFATHLVEQLGKPITATSANRSGMAAAVTVEEVRSQMGDSVEALIDGGRLPSRSGSTLLDLTADPPVLLREGPVTFESLDDFFKGRLRRQVA